MLTVRIALRYVLIILGIIVLLGCLFLCVLFYTQNVKLTQNVRDINISIEDLKKRNDILNNDNQKLKVGISNTNDLLLKTSQEKKDLENKMIGISDNFKNNIREMDRKIQEDVNLISQLQKDNLNLKTDNLSLKRQLEEESANTQSQIDKEEPDSVAYTTKMVNLKGLIPNDFVTDF